MLPVIRYGARSAPRRRPVATLSTPWTARLVDRLLGVSRRRRQAGYLAVASGLGLLRPMLRRLGIAVVVLVLLPLVAAYLRLVF